MGLLLDVNGQIKSLCRVIKLLTRTSVRSPYVLMTLDIYMGPSFPYVYMCFLCVYMCFVPVFCSTTVENQFRFIHQNAPFAFNRNIGIYFARKSVYNRKALGDDFGNLISQHILATI